VVDANDASLAAVLADKKDVVGQRLGNRSGSPQPTASAR
jgi:hypothetical protein